MVAHSSVVTRASKSSTGQSFNQNFNTKPRVLKFNTNQEEQESEEENDQEKYEDNENR